MDNKIIYIKESKCFIVDGKIISERELTPELKAQYKKEALKGKLLYSNEMPNLKIERNVIL